MSQADTFGWRLGAAWQHRIEPRWMDLKDQGNAALKAGEYLSAASFYTDALLLAQPSLALDIIVRGATAGSSDLLLRKLVQTEVLLKKIYGYLKNGLGATSIRYPGLEEPIHITVPNLPAAMCLANRSHAQLLRGNLDAACCDAESASQVCPEYVKGHKRCVEVYRKMGRGADLKRVANKISVYEENVSGMPFYAAALLSADLISDMDLVLVYLNPWTDHCLSEVERSKSRAVGMMASLVNFLDGQWLMCSLTYLDQSYTKHKLDAVDFRCVDVDNGSQLELPPDGRASKSALKGVQKIILQFCGLLKERGIEGTSLMLGQGLTGHVKLLEPIVCKVFDRVMVYPAMSTGASLAHMEKELGLYERSLG